MLLTLYHQALKAFPDLNHKTALTIPTAAPTPELGLTMTARKIVNLLQRRGRRNDPHWLSRSSWH